MTTTPNFAHEDAAYFMSEDGVTKRIARVALVDEDGVPAGVTAEFDGTKLDGAAFVTGTDKVMPSGYVQRATPTTHSDGDVGAARMDSRQRLYVTREPVALALTDAAPTPTGTDILMAGGAAVASTDLTIRNTTAHVFFIPVAAAGFRNCRVSINLLSNPDQQFTVNISAAHSVNLTESLLAAFATPANNVLFSFGSQGTGGQGVSAGGATAATANWYSIPALQYINLFALSFQAATAPTTGTIVLRITRS